MGSSVQSTRFLLLYALACTGGAIAYVPLLTILLPVRVLLVAQPGDDVAWLAYIAFTGAIAASVSHLGFGYLSDITRNRRTWIWLGLISSCGLLMAVNRATGLTSLLVWVVVWQFALNMMLAPLGALGGDCVPDRQKGLLGGLLAVAPGLGAVSGALVTINGLASADGRMALVALMVACCIVPVLVVRLPVDIAEPESRETPSAGEGGEVNRSSPNGSVQRMWFARLSVQIAQAGLFSYLYFWFRSIDPAMGDNRTARIFSTVLLISAPIALLVGRWSDRRNRPLVPLTYCAAISAIALGGMAMARSLPSAIGAYVVFGLASSVFLALHSAHTLRVLPRADRRGRDLGLFNLANTVPSLIVPWLTLAMVPYFGFPGLLVLFAASALFASLLLGASNRHGV